MIICKLFVVFSALFYGSESAKILAVFPMAMPSHYILGSQIFKELAKRGHEVTVISPYPQKTPIKNFRDISIESIIAKIDEHKKNFYSMEGQTLYSNALFMSNMGLALSENVLKHENVQKLLQSDEEFDLVIIAQYLNEALLGIAHHYKSPSILISTMPLFAWGSFLLAHPTPPSYVPNLLSEYPAYMNFWQRLSNTLYDLYSILFYNYVMLPKHRALVKEYIPGQPDLYEFLNNASLILLNSDVSSCDAMPQVPNAIEIGGAHITEPKQLPEDLQKFLDESVNGVILFSMGSNLRSSDLSEDKRNEILKAFSKLKQNILWKWETDTLPNQPKNVKLMKWLPQNDILAHPNVKVFITHGGLLSTMESIYHGVPTVGIPVYVDQKMNMARAVHHGYAVLLPFKELSEEKLSWALNEILDNPKYRENAQMRSQIMKDRPIKPLDHALYWIEYVIRYQGAPQLRYPGMALNWAQRNLLDVFVFMIFVIVILFYVIFIIFKRFCCSYKKQRIRRTKLE